MYEDLRSGFVLTPSHFLVSNRKLGLVPQIMSIILKMKICNLIVKILLQNLLKVGRKANDIWTHFGNLERRVFNESKREITIDA